MLCYYLSAILEVPNKPKRCNNIKFLDWISRKKIGVIQLIISHIVQPKKLRDALE